MAITLAQPSTGQSRRRSAEIGIGTISVFGFTAGISVVGSPADATRMTDVDASIDDGDLSSGAFKSTAGDRYTSVIEQ